MNRIRSILVIAVGAMVPLMPVAAQAQTWSYADFTGDVEQARYPHGAAWPLIPAPNRVNGDITRTSVSHRKDIVRIKVDFRELTHVRSKLYVQIRSNRLNRRLELSAGPGRWGGKAVVTSDYNGKVVRCRVRHSIDYVANRVTLDMPRSCLGNPRWVQLSVLGSTYSDSPDRIYWDEAFGHNGDVLLFTPRIKRGPGVIAGSPESGPT